MGPPRTRWLELDDFLMQFWESHSVRVEAVYHSSQDLQIDVARGVARGHMEVLLPKAMKTGSFDIVLDI